MVIKNWSSGWEQGYVHVRSN